MATERNRLIIFYVSCLIAHLILNTFGDDDIQPINSNVANEIDGDNDTDISDAKIEWKPPTILIVTLFRNKAHILPYFFAYLDQLDYPKERISLWLRSDHNEDNTNDVLHSWLYKSSRFYHHVDFEYESEPKRWTNETSLFQWPDERHSHIIRQKEASLNYAREIWADFIFFLDADVLLTTPSVLAQLVQLNRPLVAPMVISDGLYSNFWCGMTNDYYYQRTDEYMQIYNFDKRGEFRLPMIHSAILINLNDKRTDTLTFNRTNLVNQFNINDMEQKRIPLDDIIIFSLSANYSGLPMYVVNHELYGFILAPLDPEDDLNKDIQQLINTKILIINEYKNVDKINVGRELEQYITYPKADTLGVDKILMINLERRPERRLMMETSFKELGLEVEHIAAVDGQELTDTYLNEIGVRFLPGYADPYHNRPMTLGEIGCFLSHFLIWEKMVVENLNEVLVLEDDIRFEPFFKERALNILQEAKKIGGWDLIYFGRKRLDHDEYWVKNAEHLVLAGYSYWTLGYVLRLEGAKKLLAANPLHNLIPVDEYIPIMFNQHFNETWKKAFESYEKITAWSAAPLILFPTHYTGEDGYVSDTEESMLIQIEKSKKEKKGNKENLENHQTISDKTETRFDSTQQLKACSVNDPEQCINESDEMALVIDSVVKEQTTFNKPGAHHTEL